MKTRNIAARLVPQSAVRADHETVIAAYADEPITPELARRLLRARITSDRVLGYQMSVSIH